MSDKAVNICPFVFNSVPDQFKTHKMGGKVVFKKPFMLKDFPDKHENQEMEPFMLEDFPDKYENQEMCDEAADFYLIILIFVPD